MIVVATRIVNKRSPIDMSDDLARILALSATQKLVNPSEFPALIR